MPLVGWSAQHETGTSCHCGLMAMIALEAGVELPGMANRSDMLHVHGDHLDPGDTAIQPIRRSCLSLCLLGLPAVFQLYTCVHIVLDLRHKQPCWIDSSCLMMLSHISAEVLQTPL